MEYKERQEKYNFSKTIFSNRNIYSKTGHKYLNVIADSGYESEENYLFLESNNQIPYIKPQTYEKWKKRSFKNDISKRESNFETLFECDLLENNLKELLMNNGEFSFEIKPYEIKTFKLKCKIEI